MDILLTPDANGRKYISSFTYCLLTTILVVGVILIARGPRKLPPPPMPCYQINIFTNDPVNFLKEIRLPCASGPLDQYVIDMKITPVSNPNRAPLESLKHPPQRQKPTPVNPQKPATPPK